MQRAGRVEAVMVGGILALVIGCGQEPEAKRKYKPRERPQFHKPMAVTQPTESADTAPTGIERRAGSTKPAPMARERGRGRPGSLGGVVLPFTAPEGWVKKEPRFMTAAVYALPRAAGDPEDADLAVSFLGRLVPLEMNINRWCGQFAFPEGKTCAEVVQQRILEGTKYTTTIVDISGIYKGGLMMGPVGSPKPGYRMLAAEVQMPGKPWYVKLVGPKKTVARWEEAFLRFVRGAE